MASAAGALPAFAVALGPSRSGAINYAVGSNLVYELQALAFQVNLTASAQADDIWVEIRSQNNLLITGAVVGAAQAIGTIVAYTLAPHLNPCDGITVSTSISLVPDTFPSLTLTEGCQISIQALKSSNGGADTAAVISEAVAWVEGVGTATLSDEVPLLTPLSLADFPD